MSVLSSAQVVRQYGGGLYNLPGQVSSQNVSLEFPLFGGMSAYPETIPHNPVPIDIESTRQPDFRTGVDEFDWFRVLLLLAGVLVGVSIARSL